MVGPITNAPVQRSSAIKRHSSSASTRRVKTLVPPKWNVASVVMNVATWNNGPEFKYTYSLSTRCRLPITRSCTSTAQCESSAPFGRPVNAAV